MWARLRRHAIGHRFRRQHPVGPYVIDFACVAVKLAVEIDGDSHYAHPREAAYDAERTRFLERNGWAVIRATNDDVRRETDAVLAMIRTTADDLARAHCSP